MHCFHYVRYSLISCSLLIFIRWLTLITLFSKVHLLLFYRKKCGWLILLMMKLCLDEIGCFINCSSVDFWLLEFTWQTNVSFLWLIKWFCGCIWFICVVQLYFLILINNIRFHLFAFSCILKLYIIVYDTKYSTREQMF